jgi:hypothetical protein
MSIPWLLSQHFLLVLIAFVSICVFILLGFLLKQQLIHIWKNLTVNESLNWQRYSYLQKTTTAFNGTTGNSEKAKKLVNPFDRMRNRWQNVWEFLQLTNYRIDYRTLFEIPSDNIDLQLIP